MAGKNKKEEPLSEHFSQPLQLADSRWGILSSPIGHWPHFPDFSSHPANRNLCPAGICLFGHFSALCNTFSELPRRYPVTIGYFPPVLLYVYAMPSDCCNSLQEYFTAAIGKNMAISFHS
jgi:hypothetical protein